MPTANTNRSISWSHFGQKNFRGQLLVWREDNLQFSGTINEITVKPGKSISISLKEIETRESVNDEWQDYPCPVRTIYFNASREPINDELGILIGQGGSNTGTIMPVKNRAELQKILLSKS